MRFSFNSPNPTVPIYQKSGSQFTRISRLERSIRLTNSSEYGIMFHPNQIADIGVVVTAGICSLTATTKSGITGITTFSLTRQDQS